MEENVNVTNEVVTVEQNDVTPVQQETKTGLTTGQKIAGGTVIGFAIGGIVWLILSIIKGVKWIIGKIKNRKKKEEPAKTEEAPKPAPAPVDAEEFTDDGPLSEEEIAEIEKK